MTKRHPHPESVNDEAPTLAVWTVGPLFVALAVVIGGVMVYVAQEVPEQEVARSAGDRHDGEPSGAPRPGSGKPSGQPQPSEPIEPFAEHSAKPARPKPHVKPERPAPPPEPVSAPREEAAAPIATVAPRPEPEIPAPANTPDPASPSEPEGTGNTAANEPEPEPEPAPSEGSTQPAATEVAAALGQESVQPDVPQKPEPVAPAAPSAHGPAIPDKATITAKTKEVRLVFKADYAARDPAARAALAQRLARDAESTLDDPTTAYVLAIEARDQATQVGDYETYIAAGRLLEERYGVDTFDEDVVAFPKMPVVSNKSTAWYHGFIGEIANRVDDCCQRDDFERATRYASVAKSIASKASDPATAQEWTARIKELAALKIQFGTYKAAKETLQANPADGPGNAKWGTYLCLVRGNFAEGLPYLMKGDDATLAALAKRDLNPDRNATETLAVADAWWNYGEKSKAFRGQAWHHAGELYQSELPNLTGLAATKVEKRLAELAAAAAPTRMAPLNPVERALIASPWSVRWDRAARPRDIEGVRGGNTAVDENDWSHEETITFHEGGRVESRYFDRYELGPDFIALYVPQDENQQGFAGPPGRPRDRRFYGRARFMGNELQFIIFRGDNIENPRNRGIGSREEKKAE